MIKQNSIMTNMSINFQNRYFDNNNCLKYDLYVFKISRLDNNFNK